MKKIISMVFAFFAIALCVQSAQAANVQKVKPKAPVITEEMKPAIAKYRAENFVGALQDFEGIAQKEPNNFFAKYYIALCYTQLGYKDKATQAYQEVVDANSNLSLTYYSKRALDCLNNPDSTTCQPQFKALNEDDKDTRDMSDIEKFILSGKKIHPSAMDKIINDRLERKLEEEEYIKKQQGVNQNLKSQAPTNEEIAQALNTLSKIGYNPFQNLNNQNQMLSQFGYNPMILDNSNPEMAQMLLYSQLNNQFRNQFGPFQNNNFMNNYGI